MIKVLEEKPVPKATITCNNCGSLLEYSNADLIYNYYDSHSTFNYTGITNFKLRCPVCSCEQTACWIHKKEESHEK